MGEELKVKEHSQNSACVLILLARNALARLAMLERNNESPERVYDDDVSR